MRAFSIITTIGFSLANIATAKPLDVQGVFSTSGNTQAHLTSSATYTDCGLPTNPVQIESVEFSPNPPKPGEDLTVKVKATVTETIEEGAYADVTVKLGLIKLLSKEFDLCEEARNANLTVQCPVQNGSYEVVHTVQLPKEVPPAKFTVDVEGYTVDDDDLVCLKISADFRKFPF